MERFPVFDINAKQPERTTMEVGDYIELGRILVEWTRDPASRPGSVAELNRQLDGIATIPRRIKKIAFVQNDEDTLYIRLPDETLLTQTLDDLRDDCSGRLCHIPYFYRDYLDPGFGPVMSSYETLLARLGDSVATQA